MPLEARLLIGLAAALAVVHLTTPLAIRVAERFEFYDQPGRLQGPRARRRRTSAAPRWSPASSSRSCCSPATGTGRCRCSAASLVLWVVGTIDDRRTVLAAARGSRSRSALGAGAVGARARLGPRAGPRRRPRGHARSGSSPSSTRSTCSTTWTAPRASMAAVVAGGLALLGVVEGEHVAGGHRAPRCAAPRSGSCRTTCSPRPRGSSSATAAACRSASRSRRSR